MRSLGASLASTGARAASGPPTGASPWDTLAGGVLSGDCAATAAESPRGAAGARVPAPAWGAGDGRQARPIKPQAAKRREQRIGQSSGCRASPDVGAALRYPNLADHANK